MTGAWLYAALPNSAQSVGRVSGVMENTCKIHLSPVKSSLTYPFKGSRQRGASSKGGTVVEIALRLQLSFVKKDHGALLKC